MNKKQFNALKDQIGSFAKARLTTLSSKDQFIGLIMLLITFTIVKLFLNRKLLGICSRYQ